MNVPAGYVARAATRADIDGIVAMLHAGDVVAVGRPDTPKSFVDEVFSSPFVDPSADIWVVEDASGTIAAGADIRAPDPTQSCDAFVRVHPDHAGRGLASALLDRCEVRARERAGGPTRLLATAEPADPAGLRLLRDRGHEHVRSFLHMQRTVDDLEPTTPVPEGVGFRAFRDDRRDWATFHHVLETTFEDHFDAVSLDLDTFVWMWTDMPTWDPGLVTFATAGDDVVGVVVSDVLDGEGLGWISEVGVLEAFRGRGIGRALLLRAFTDLRERGCDRVRLNVDAENTTGATRLYEAAGMHVHRGWRVFEKLLGDGNETRSPSGRSVRR